MPRADARHLLHRGPGSHKKDPQAPGTMGGKPATLPAGKALTSTQSDLSACVHAQEGWAAKTRGTSYRLFHVPAPCACPPLEGRISGFMSTRNIPRCSPSDFRNLRASHWTCIPSSTAFAPMSAEPPFSPTCATHVAVCNPAHD